MKFNAIIEAITPDCTGFVTNMRDGNGEPFIYYPNFKNIVQPDKVGMRLIVESGNGRTIERVV